MSKKPRLTKTSVFGDTLDAAARCELLLGAPPSMGNWRRSLCWTRSRATHTADTPRAFAQHALALVLAQELAASGQDRGLPAAQRVFVYMPYMHSESAMVHQQALTLFAQPGMENNLDFERRHKAIIDRFGRYPHRNAVLGRTSTPEELAFLSEPGSSF